MNYPPGINEEDFDETKCWATVTIKFPIYLKGRMTNSRAAALAEQEIEKFMDHIDKLLYFEVELIKKEVDC